MEYLTESKFLQQLNKEKHLNPEHWGKELNEPGRPKSTDRWNYHKKAVELLKELRPKSVLEAGSMGIFLTDKSDSIDLDIPEWGWRLSYEPTYNYDLTELPWKPIADKQYDVFVALRLFHHFENERAYLKEMERISNKIILVLTTASAFNYELVRKADLKYYFPETDSCLLFYRN